METNIEVNDKVCEATCSTDKISPKWVLRIKSFIRPFITYSWHIFTIVILTMYILNKIPVSDKDVVKDVLTIETVIIIFWFGERLARNVGVVDFIKSFKSGYNKKEN